MKHLCKYIGFHYAFNSDEYLMIVAIGPLGQTAYSEKQLKWIYKKRLQ